MELTNARRVAARLEWRDAAGSTNEELRRLARAEPLPHGTVVATANQAAGRGRLQREWITPPGTALAISVLLRGVGQRGLAPSWIPLLAGGAVTEALQPRVPAGLRVGVKWPNDVHVRDEAEAEAGLPGRKLCGILSELLSDGAIIVGMGVNVLQGESDLPTDRATSLRVIGAEVGGADTLERPPGEALADDLVAAIVGGLLDAASLAADHPDAARQRVRRHSLTLGSRVRVHLPGDEIVDGVAVGLDPDGALEVDRATGGRLVVNAGDIEHLR